jgi:hypothetical protein
VKLAYLRRNVDAHLAASSSNDEHVADAIAPATLTKPQPADELELRFLTTCAVADLVRLASPSDGSVHSVEVELLEPKGTVRESGEAAAAANKRRRQTRALTDRPLRRTKLGLLVAAFECTLEKGSFRAARMLEPHNTQGRIAQAGPTCACASQQRGVCIIMISFIVIDPS